YNAADTYFSLSLHHDEDFGMSPAEALCSGASAVLSDWGGYASFTEKNSETCRLIPIEFNSRHMGLASPEIIRALVVTYLHQKTSKERQDQSLRYQNRFSIQAATKVIEQIHRNQPPQFSGFNRRMDRLGKRFSSHTVFPGGPKRGGFYEEI